MTTTIVKRQNGDMPVSFGNVVDNIFQNSLRRFFDDNFREPGAALTTGSVPVNVRETNKHYELDVIAPGCKKEDFTIKIADNILTIGLEQKDEKREQNEKSGWARSEFVQRSFSRSFTLDDSVDINKIDARYSDGILRLILPKNEKAQQVARNIEIR